MSAVIEVSELIVELDGARVVDGVSFSVVPGQVVALLGPNGAGKTTTIETIEGYRKPTGGRVSVAGFDPFTQRDRLADRWGVMPQTGGLPMGLTVGEAIELFAALHGSAPAVDAIVDSCGLRPLAKKRWRRLSGGEQQRLSLALALCGGTDVLLLDEPTAALDARGREAVLELIIDRAADGAAVLVTTHRFDDVERTADDVVVLDRGQVRHASPLDELTSGQPHIRFTADAGLPIQALSSRLDAPVSQTSVGTYQIDIDPSPEAVSVLTSWLAEHNTVAQSISSGTRSLEEIMLALEPDTPGSNTGESA